MKKEISFPLAFILAVWLFSPRISWGFYGYITSDTTWADSLFVDGDVVVEKDVILRAAPDRLPRSAWVSLKIYNILGQEVKDLVKGLQPEGVHRLSWDGRGNNREKVRSGVYFCVLQIKKSRFAGRMVLIR